MFVPRSGLDLTAEDETASEWRGNASSAHLASTTSGLSFSTI